MVTRVTLPSRPQLASVADARPVFTLARPGMHPTIRFTAQTPPENGKIDDDIYDLIRGAYKNELHVHQSGSSDIAFLKYALIKGIQDGTIKQLSKVDAHAGTQQTYELDKLPPDELAKVLDEVLDWENLREYFRFYIQAERGKDFIPSSALRENAEQPLGLEVEDYFNHLRDYGLEAYRATSSKINPLVKNKPAAYLLAHLYAWDVANENIRYAEYRVSPVGRNFASYKCSTEDLLHYVGQGFEDARKRLLPNRRDLDYGIIVLMERQGETITRDPQKLLVELSRVLEKYQLPHRDKLTRGWMRTDALLQRAADMVAGYDSQPMLQDLRTLFAECGIRLEKGPQAQTPQQFLNIAAEAAREQEKIKGRNALALARETVELRKKGHNIVGIDLAGDELNNPSEEFAEAFRVIRDYNEDPATPPERRIGITIHAGETSRSGNLSGAEAIEKAIALAWSPKTPVRIGHGVQLINSSPALKEAFETYLQNPRDWKAKIDIDRLLKTSPLLKDVIEKGIILEMCPKSNLQTYGVHPGMAKGKPDEDAEKYSARSYKKHPAVFLSRLGVKVAISTDNRTISNSDVTNEFVKLYKYAGLTYQDFKTMVLNGFEGAFIFDPEKKAKVMADARRRFEALESVPANIRAIRKMGYRLNLLQRIILLRVSIVERLRPLFQAISRFWHGCESTLQGARRHTA